MTAPNAQAGTHDGGPLAARAPVVALVGNPNTGKTTLFNALAGMRQRTGNYPGVTVETKKGRCHHDGATLELIDLPGTYSLAARSPDEMVAVDVILGRQPGEPRPDVVVAIVDASNLERNLYLTTQVLELGVPVVVALNMIDVAAGQGIEVEAPLLQRRLGVPVVPIQANRRVGIELLKEAVAKAAGGPAPEKHPGFPEAFEREVEALRGHLGDDVPPFLVRRLLIDAGGWTEHQLAGQSGNGLAGHVAQARQRLAAAGCPVPAVEARARYGWIREVTAGCVRRPQRRAASATDRLDRVLTHKVWGTLVFLALMFLVFVALFEGAAPFMDWIGAGQDWLAGQVGGLMSPGPLRGLIVDGLIKGVGSVVVFLPQIIILFAFIAVLEECGYMARAAFLMDRLMARAGLNGKSFIPLLSSVACAIPGIMGARVIENRRDRLATILVAPLMSCSARLPVYSILIGAFLGPAAGYPWWVAALTMLGLYLLGMVLAPLVAYALKSTVLRGETPAFVMEMPLYRWPSPRTVLYRAGEAGWMFVRRAGTVILASMVVIWALLYFPATNPDTGESFDAEIAALAESVEEEKEQRDELAGSIAEQKAKLKALTEKAEEDDASAADLLRIAELKAEVAPVEAEIRPLEAKIAPVEEKINGLSQRWKEQSVMGQAGHALEPVFRPLGWDWRIGMAALASFPAREVMVGTLGIVFGQGEGDADDDTFAEALGTEMNQATWADDPSRKLFTVPVALSVLVFFALCCQCASTLAVIRRETNSWGWPVFTFVYMTVLAYIGALVVYQVGSLF
jgi:ferrous iron transport protein B